ncbi:MAG: polysaccharide export protein [Xanthomonadales bacterium]|jgi:polysaccharide export outer membrane protein|nr:polysaccharide export protein [Xanthomonadales bacterium]MBK7145047.1 polysaccharide export protein [Xanthomonadales bacterium]MCC6561290.1 polysaccharide export protein [Xanthomonadales bacterium]
MTLKPLLSCLALCGLLLLAGCASSGGAIRSGTAKAVTSTDSLPPPDTTSASGAYTGVADYRVGALDLLEVSVFQVADLNRTVRINSNGYISLPLVGAVAAGGKTVSELEAEIAKRLSEQYLQNPQVSVFVKEYSSQRITVEGAVQSPGIFPITGPTTLLQVIAMVKGFDPMADDRSIIVFRKINGQKMAALFNIRNIRAGEAEDPRIYGDDIVVVERSGVRSAYHSLVNGLRNVIGFAVL